MAASRGDRRRSSRPLRPGAENLEGRALTASLYGPFIPGNRLEIVVPVINLNTPILKGPFRPQAAAQAATNHVRSQAVVRTTPATPAPNFQTLLNPPQWWRTTPMFRR